MEEQNGKEKAKEFKCITCGKTYSSAPSLSRHKKATHSDLKKTCDICKEEVSFTRKDNYERHVQRCVKKMAKTKVSHHCPPCKKTFDTKQHYERHMDTKKHKEPQKVAKVKLPTKMKFTSGRGKEKANKKIRVPKKPRLEEWEDGYETADDYSDNFLSSMVDVYTSEFQPGLQWDEGEGNRDEETYECGMPNQEQANDNSNTNLNIYTSSNINLDNSINNIPDNSTDNHDISDNSFFDMSVNKVPDTNSSNNNTNLNISINSNINLDNSINISNDHISNSNNSNNHLNITNNSNTNKSNGVDNSVHDVSITNNIDPTLAVPTNASAQPPSTPRRKCRGRRFSPGTPRTLNKRTINTKKKRKSRAIDAILQTMKSSFKQHKIPKDSEAEVMVSCLKSHGAYDQVDKLFRAERVTKPRGISRTADDTINKIWTFFNENSTVSNAKTSRPAKCAADEFDKNPLLCRVLLEPWNIQVETTKRKKRQYVHQYQVQDGTLDELYRKFCSENGNIKIGITTFKKISPFYVRPCNPTDIETCTCRTHVNFRNAIEALLKFIQQKDNQIKFIFHDEDKEIDALGSYQNFMKYLYKNCKRDGHGLLIASCENGDGGHWMKNWDLFKTFADPVDPSPQHLQVKQKKDTIKFQRFEYQVTEKY